METLNVLRKNGMDVTVLTPKQVKAFKEKTKSVYDKWAQEIGAELVAMAEKDIQKATKGAAKPAPKTKAPKK